MPAHPPAATYHGVAVPPSDFLTDQRIARLNSGAYEGDEVRGALSIITAEDRVLELGAGLGVVGAAIARNCKPAAMMSFEANPALIPQITDLYARNRLKTKIKLQNAVLVATPNLPDHLPFYVRSSYLGSSLTKAPARPTKKVEVPTVDWAKMHGSFAPTVLVMDIEGGEEDLLAHANLDGIRAIILEFHPKVYGVSGMRALKSRLRELGFRKEEAVSTRLVWTCTRDVT